VDCRRCQTKIYGSSEHWDGILHSKRTVKIDDVQLQRLSS
jgi:hypothetical protein